MIDGTIKGLRIEFTVWGGEWVESRVGSRVTAMTEGGAGANRAG